MACNSTAHGIYNLIRVIQVYYNAIGDGFLSYIESTSQSTEAKVIFQGKKWASEYLLHDHGKLSQGPVYNLYQYVCTA